jgi:CO/xanthine dehydrogenase FAD-binding subunit
MVDTRILVNRFEYIEPQSLKEAVELLGHYGDGATILAGGTNSHQDLRPGAGVAALRKCPEKI